MVNQLSEINPRATIGDNNPPKAHELFARDLAETYAREFNRIEPIATRATNAPGKIASDEDLKVWTGVYLDAIELHKSLDAGRLNEQRPMVAVLKAVFGPHLERLERIVTHGRKLADDYNREKVRKEQAARTAEVERQRREAAEAREKATIAAEFGDMDGAVAAVQEVGQIETQIAQTVADAPAPADVARVRTDDGGLSTAKGEWKFEIADYSKVDLNAIRSFFAPADIEKAVRKVVKIQKGATKIEGVRVFEDVATQFRR